MSDMTHPLPYASWESRGWWEGAGRGEIVLQRCRTCGLVQHKPRGVCVRCLTDTIEYLRPLSLMVANAESMKEELASSASSNHSCSYEGRP